MLLVGIRPPSALSARAARKRDPLSVRRPCVDDRPMMAFIFNDGVRLFDNDDGTVAREFI